MKGKFWSIVLGAVALLFIILLIARDYSHRYPPDVKEALKKAGENRAELEKVINHYRDNGDFLQLRATYFLIGNMDGHSYVIYELQDTSGAKVDFNVLDYPDYKTMVAAWDRIEAERGSINFTKKEIRQDLKNIKADFLIENIDLAFKAWREKPWAQYLSFEEFCEYVLPYRGSNEPLERWRPYFMEEFKDLGKDLQDPSDPIEAACYINDDLKTWFKFDPLFYRHPTDQGLEEMLKNKMGRCEDMTNLAIYAMRANGLPVTSDYTPHWADTGNNHAWNAILDRDGKVIMFMGVGPNPGEYKLNNRMAKVYRKTYSIQKQNLVFQKEAWEKVPAWLSRKNYMDVTPAYTSVSDVTVALEQPVPDSVNFAYLCVFNDGEWKAIHWGRIKRRQVTFTDMGRNIAYLPMYFVKDKLTPAAAAFILEKSGTIRQLNADEKNKITITLISTTRRKQLADTDGIEKAFFEPGRNYELFYWKDGWQSLGTQRADDKPLVFEQVPADGLYWLVAEGSRKDERIFTIEDGKQVWW